MYYILVLHCTCGNSNKNCKKGENTLTGGWFALPSSTDWVLCYSESNIILLQHIIIQVFTKFITYQGIVGYSSGQLHWMLIPVINDCWGSFKTCQYCILLLREDLKQYEHQQLAIDQVQGYKWHKHRQGQALFTIRQNNYYAPSTATCTYCHTYLSLFLNYKLNSVALYWPSHKFCYYFQHLLLQQSIHTCPYIYCF